MFDPTTAFPNTRYLPPELVDQILQDSSLTRADLARCSLVNRDFLHGVRPVLYVELTVTTICPTLGEGYWLDNATLSLFRTLLNEPSLSQYARKASFRAVQPGKREEEETGVYSGSTYKNCGEVVEQVLEMLPQLESLDLDAFVWNSTSTKEMILARGLQWREIVVEIALLEEDMDGNRRTWSKLPNLKRLRCGFIYGDPDDTLPLPDHLEVLDITSSYAQDFPLSLSPGSQLRILRAVLSNSKLQHLGHMRQLRHLYLFIGYNYSPGCLSLEALNALSRLPLLESLSVEYEHPTQQNNSVVQPLFQYLPRSLQRLDFPRCIPFDALTQLLRPDETAQVQILGFGQSPSWNALSHEDFRGRIEQLRRICEEKRIAIERIELRGDIFPLKNYLDSLIIRLTLRSLAHTSSNTFISPSPFFSDNNSREGGDCLDRSTVLPQITSFELGRKSGCDQSQPQSSKIRFTHSPHSSFALDLPRSFVTMFDTTLTLSIPRSTPYLPPELVGQILQDSSLSKSDLARCCLINHDFLHSARPLLYAELTVTTIYLCLSEECWLDNATSSLFRTVSMNPSLGQYARKVGFRASYPEKEGDSVYIGPSYDDCGLVVERALEMLPLLESLDLDGHVLMSDHAKEMVFSRGPQWRELVVDGTLLEEDTDGNRRTWSKLRNLKKLRCKVVNDNSGDASPIPDHLEVLNITSSYPQDITLSLTPGSRLRILRVTLSNSKLQHLAYMRQLQHLYVFAGADTGSLSLETLNALSRLPLLESLSVEYYHPATLNRSLIVALLHRLPHSLLRLNFPQCIPFDGLSDFLQTDAPQFRILGLGRTSSWNKLPPAEFEECKTRLSEICKGKGILIERVILRKAIFLV
ncbi:hypothetical protein JCM5353_002626 [Sporobolomyces roseus]